MTAVRLLAPMALLCLVSCGGGGGGSSAPATPPPTSVTLSGTVTFDKVSFSANAGGGLDLANAAAAPARGVTVEAIAAANQAVLATAVADASGQYTFSVPVSTELFVRAKAELRRTGTPSWTVAVRDNTSSDALYAVDTTPFNSGTSALTRNVHAGLGWTPGTGYTGVRAAAPFSVLDVAYQAIQLVLTADANMAFPELKLFWSTRNIDCAEGTVNGASYCDQSAAARQRGEIGTSFFSDIQNQGRSIYVLGAATSDTDEFDQHVLAHEWGHYYQDAFSRDDSVGGSHSLTDRLDLRVAFSEGWGNAFSAMVKGDPVYRDSFLVNGQQRDFRINVEDNPAAPVFATGWFSEASVQSIFYDLYDSANDGADAVSLGFGPIHTAMTGPLRTTTAFSSIYPLVRALRGISAGVTTLVASQNIDTASDDFGSTETNAGGVPSALPIYPVLVPGVARQVCSLLPLGNSSAVFNKLGNRKFVRFDLAVTQNVSLAVTGGTTGSDPDMLLYSAGTVRARAESADSGSETLNATGLVAGTYIAEIFEYSNISPEPTPRGTECFTVRLTTS